MNCLGTPHFRPAARCEKYKRYDKRSGFSHRTCSENHNINQGAERKSFLQQMTGSVSLCVRMKSWLFLWNWNRPFSLVANWLDKPVGFFVKTGLEATREEQETPRQNVDP